MNSVTTSLSNHIATITFSNPPHNALPGSMLSELTNAITDAGNDTKVRVILLQSAGERSFCAGASFDELAAISNMEEGTRFFMGFANVINACRKCPKLIIGRLQGKAVGGGVGLAAAVDYCMATKYASVKLSELALGIGPFVVGPALERKIGVSAFSQLSMNATEWQTASWAKEKGLFAEVFDTVDQLDEYIARFTGILGTQNPDAMKSLKRIFWQGCEHWDTLLEERAAVSGKLVLSDYTRQAIEKFKARTD
ncbi:MAG TPA: enoyl-CoA hydratase/isomerase family protein [Saprospiraceae bacterium]|nr:enoyl-CoA hydratase/isomerase family protein [Saprospiraceae bacterium]